MAKKPQAQIKTRCKQPKRNKITGMPEGTCGGAIMNGSCAKRDEHVNKYKTGFCGNGHCEGTNHKSRTGRYYKTCSFWLTCPCPCHEVVSLMYKMAGRERKAAEDNYVAEKSDFVLPNRDEIYAEKLAAQEVQFEVIKAEIPSIPDRIKREFSGQTAGRSHRGQLEQHVQDCCDEWMKGDKKKMCTTTYISDWIYENCEDIKTPPSRGAIDAVLKRWTKLNFALIAPKPTRFAGYTPDGVKLGLEGLKRKKKLKSPALLRR